MLNCSFSVSCLFLFVNPFAARDDILWFSFFPVFFFFQKKCETFLLLIDGCQYPRDTLIGKITQACRLLFVCVVGFNHTFCKTALLSFLNTGVCLTAAH